MKRILMLTIPVLALTTGCEELEPFTPTVEFDTMTLEGLSFEAAEVDFVFEVHNPNPVNIGLASFSYDLGLEGISLVTGDDPDGFQLPAEEFAELRLPVRLDYTDTYDAISATRGQDFVGFNMAGDFGFDTPIGEIAIPYDEGGDFPALRTPKFKMKKLRVANVNLLQNRATVELDIDVDNDHGSNLQFDNLNYDLNLAGVNVGSGAISPFDVDGALSKQISIPFEINLLNAGSTVVNAVTNKQPLNAGLDVDMDVLVPFLDNPIPLTVNESGDIEVQ